MNISKRVAFVDVVFGIAEFLKRDFLKLLVNSIMFIAVLWVPYLNLCALAGLMALPVKLAKGGEIDWLEIFKKEYGERLNEYFIIFGLMMTGAFFAGSLIMRAKFVFGIRFLCMPRLFMLLAFLSVLALLAHWVLAPLLVNDKKCNAMEAFSGSFRVMDGNKLTYIMSVLILGIISKFFMWVLGLIPFFHRGRVVVITLMLLTVVLCLWACFYRVLVTGFVAPDNNR